MYRIKATVVILGMMLLAGFTVHYVEKFFREIAETKTVSNFLKNDWTTCDGIYYPDSAKQTTFEL